jgi:hypothetical protein
MGRPRDHRDATQDIARDLTDIAAQLASLSYAGVAEQVLDEPGTYATAEQEGRFARLLPALAEEGGTVVVTADDKLLGGPGVHALRPRQSSPGRRRKPHPKHELTTTHVLQPG